MDSSPPQARQARACEVARAGEYVVLVLEDDEDGKLVAVMSPKEARRLLSRIGKAANDAAAAAERERIRKRQAAA